MIEKLLYDRLINAANDVSSGEFHPGEVKNLLREAAATIVVWREALIECAQLAGVGGEAVQAARDGAMKHPPLSAFATMAVKQLRLDYEAS